MFFLACVFFSQSARRAKGAKVVCLVVVFYVIRGYSQMFFLANVFFIAKRAKGKGR